MATHQLAGSRVLVVEDEYYLADDARTVLSGCGAEVVGPVATVSQAREMIDADAAIDVVLLDVNLRGELAFEVADTLRSRDIPFAFVTGYDRAALPDRFADATRLQKPIAPERLVACFSDLVKASNARA